MEQTASRPDVDHGPVDALVDWDLAVQAAGHLVRPGPQVGADEARQVVEQLRGFARDSTGYVAETTGLVATPGEDVLVVDRTGWVTANVDAFRELLAPAVAAAQSKRDRPPGPVVQAVGRKVTGVELGSLLSFLASKVLGQYDIADPSGGRLLLVAPNIVQVERELDAEPADFRLWVCLHEETHRVQFTANPWLRAHLLESSRAMVTDLLGDPGQLTDRITAAARHLPDVLRGGDGTGLLELVQSPEQRAGAGPRHRRDVAARGPRRRRHGRGRPAGDPDGGRHPRAVHRPARGQRRARPDAAPPARPGRQDAAVPRRRRVRPRRHRGRRHRGLQRGLDLAGHPAAARGDHRPGRLGAPGARLGRRWADPRPRSRRRAPRCARRSPTSPTPLRAAGGRDVPLVLVACSGGPDSLALAAATAHLCARPDARLRAGAVVVDHGLQERSDEVAAGAAASCRALGLDPVEVVRVRVAPDGSGPEAAARTARYAALDEVADRLGAVAVLLGHTLDDQAEQVLLGLARGSGARSLAGMAAVRGPVPPSAARGRRAPPSAPAWTTSACAPTTTR